MAVRLRTALLVSSLLLGATALAQAGDLYQWKDGNGVNHYSDAPPPKGQYRARNVHVRDAEAAAPAASQPKPKTTAIANCLLAKTNLERLKAGGDIGLDANGDGKPDASLSADERAKQTQLAEHNIKTFCTPTATTPAS